MTSTVIALLDTPSASSFGMVPFVARDSCGVLYVCGIRNRPRSALEPAELDELLRSKSALRIPELLAVDRIDQDMVAGWLGLGFRHEVARLSAPEPRVPLLHEIDELGGFWLDTPATVYGALDQWIREAAADVFSGAGSAALAELMVWVLPDRDETRAAVWHTRAPDSEKHRHLEWYVRLERDAGHPITPKDLETRLQKIVETYRRPLGERLDMLGRKPRRALDHAPLFGWRGRSDRAA